MCYYYSILHGHKLSFEDSIPQQLCFRGTKDFRILFWNGAWEDKITGTLSPVFGRKCDVSVEDFYIGEERTAKFIRVLLDSYYQKGAGLQWINFALKGKPNLDCENKILMCLALFSKTLVILLRRGIQDHRQ